jgi:adiponectin receptor
MVSVPRLRVPPKEPEARKGREKGDDASLLSFDEMPRWFQDDNNRLILHGYRPISDSFPKSLGSLMRLHNETFNIYSHLISAIVFFLGGWYISQYLAGKYPGVTSTDLVTFSFFMLTATICYAFSALYHTLMNHSYTVDHFCHRLDMLGIGTFITGDIVLGVHIIFWCETTLRNVYWSMVSRSPYARLFLFQDW